ncbi:hypothetical protein Ciccas_003177 [Cichlidogyrus casuarinus]|uniref:Uncharacterized protein n=1 Tax=Cichlidogyrus casuarinus TaxID=1844966 RepID=A0ABD2QF51_9PLAT
MRSHSRRKLKLSKGSTAESNSSKSFPKERRHRSLLTRSKRDAKRRPVSDGEDAEPEADEPAAPNHEEGEARAKNPVEGTPNDVIPEPIDPSQVEPNSEDEEEERATTPKRKKQRPAK